MIAIECLLKLWKSSQISECVAASFDASCTLPRVNLLTMVRCRPAQLSLGSCNDEYVPALHGSGQTPDDDRRSPVRCGAHPVELLFSQRCSQTVCVQCCCRVCSLVHFQLYIDVREHQGQVHAESFGAAGVRLPSVPHSQQNHQRAGTVVCSVSPSLCRQRCHRCVPRVGCWRRTSSSKCRRFA
jgi:hypothetical protein